MVAIKRIVLDVLKPHQPSAIEFAQAIAGASDDCHVRLLVLEMDEKTETMQIEVSGERIDFDAVKMSISDMGGSLHSIDEVEVGSNGDAG